MSTLVPVDEHPAEVAAQLWRRVRDLVDGLEAADWERDTPCAGWSVRDLVGHLSGTQTAFDGSAPQPATAPPDEGAGIDGWAEAAVAARRGWSSGQVRAELEAAAAGHEARLRAVTDWEAPTFGPTGRTTERGLFAVRCFDIWVHLQDLDEALGRPVGTRDGSAAARVAYGFVLDLVPWLYAKRVGAPDGSVMRLVVAAPADVDTLITRRDGRARFEPAGPAADSTLEAEPGTLTLLLSGRGDPDLLRARGALRWDGPLAESFARKARIFA